MPKKGTTAIATMEPDSVKSLETRFKDGMKLKCSVADIKTAYRLGKVSNDKPRPILVKFQNFNFRSEVWKNKKLLKGGKKRYFHRGTTVAGHE